MPAHPDPGDGRRGAAWSAGAALALLGSVAVYVVSWVGDGLPLMIDVEVYRWAADVVRSDGSLYDGYYIDLLPFTYPPFAAVVFLVLPSVPMTGLRIGSLVLGVGAVALVAWVSAGSVCAKGDWRRPALALGVAAVALQLEPVRQTFKFGQVNLVLMAIVIVDLCRSDRSRSKGLGIGVAAGFKLTPAIFVVYLLVTSRWRAARRALVAAAGTVVVGFVVLPADSADFWFGHLFTDSARTGGVEYVANQSVFGAVSRRAGVPPDLPLLWPVLALVVGVAGLWAARALSRRGQELAGICTCALTGLLVSPVSWSHHWVWVVPVLVLLVHVAIDRSRWAWIAVAAVVGLFWSWDSWDGVIWEAPFRRQRELRWSWGQSIIGNAYVLAGLGALTAVVLGLLAGRRWRRRPLASGT